MKRIIDGKTYNTDTATLIAKQVFHPQDDANFNELYRTRHGAYFVYYGNYRSPDDGTYGFVVEVKPFSPLEAQEWMESHAWAELIEEHFGSQPEAGEGESRIALRIPDTLKAKISALAFAKNQSLNTWIMRCLEACASQVASK